MNDWIKPSLNRYTVPVVSSTEEVLQNKYLNNVEEEFEEIQIALAGDLNGDSDNSSDLSGEQ